MGKEFLKELLLCPSVSGHEEAIQKKAMEYSASFCDRQIVDATGNVIHCVNPEADFKVLLMGHIDEIGFLVTHIEKDGMVRVTADGGVKAALYVGAPMQILHQGRPVMGVVAVTQDLIKSEKVTAGDLMIDIGADSDEEARKLVSPGDPVCAQADVTELLNDRFTGKALDDKTGVYVVLEAIRAAKEKGVKIGAYAATTVGEETTMRGSYWASGRIRPNLAVAVDVTFASDCPGAKPHTAGQIALGKGPVLCAGTIVNKRVNELLQTIAKEKDIPLQWEVSSSETGTDIDEAHFAMGGMPTALISIPLRYMHSSVEVGSYKDIEYCIELLSELLVRIGADFDFTGLTPLC